MASSSGFVLRSRAAALAAAAAAADRDHTGGYFDGDDDDDNADEIEERVQHVPSRRYLEMAVNATPEPFGSNSDASDGSTFSDDDDRSGGAAGSAASASSVSDGGDDGDSGFSEPSPDRRSSGGKRSAEGAAAGRGGRDSDSRMGDGGRRAAAALGADAAGYLVRTDAGGGIGGKGDAEDDPTRPPYEISVHGASTAQVISRLVWMRDEGFWSLWKGNFTRWLSDMFESIIQPSIELALNDVLDIRDEGIPLLHVENPLPLMATKMLSETLTGYLLSPLELVRTRLIVQTSNPYHRKYAGTFDCLRTTVREEGLSTLYFGRRLSSTLLYHALSPLFRHGAALLVQRVLALSPDSSPLLHEAATFLVGAAELAVLLPLETVRRRIDAQPLPRTPDAAARPFEPVVRCQQIPYAGLLDCAVRLALEEADDEAPRPPADTASRRRGAGRSGDDDYDGAGRNGRRKRRRRRRRRDGDGGGGDGGSGGGGDRRRSHGGKDRTG
ncbi:hypothetical protein HK405_009068, partial [Cladochytrium tenue]